MAAQNGAGGNPLGFNIGTISVRAPVCRTAMEQRGGDRNWFKSEAFNDLHASQGLAQSVPPGESPSFPFQLVTPEDQ